MNWQFEYTGYIWPLLVSVAFAVALCAYGWRHRTVPGATAFAFLTGGSAAWFLFGALELAGADFPTKLFWVKLEAPIKVLVTSGSFCFILEYAGLGRWLTRRTLVLLAVPPLAFALLIFSNEAHQLAWIDVEFGERLTLTRGPAAWLTTTYGYLLYLVSTLVLIWLFFRSPLHRWPVAIILAGQLAPRGAFAGDVVGSNLFSPLDPAMVFSNLTAAAYAVALFRFRLFDVVPVARETVLERMVDGMLVLDAQGRIADLNPAAQVLLDTPRSRVLGRDGALALAAFPDLARLALEPEPVQVDVLLGTPAAQRWYQVSSSPLTDRRGFRLGRLVVFRDITESRRAQELLIEQQRALAALQERDRVARELHDGLGQVLGFVKMQAQAAQGLLARDPETAESYLAQLASVAQDAHADIREYILGARTIDEAAGFLAPLRSYLERFSTSYGLAVELAVPPELRDEAFGPAVQVQLLRIIQEALTNARKHAHASHVQVKFALDGGTVEVTIADDGQGFDPEQVAGDGQRYGLRFMRERAAEVGGTVKVHSAPGQPTRVVVRVPRHNVPVVAASHPTALAAGKE